MSYNVWTFLQMFSMCIVFLYVIKYITVNDHLSFVWVTPYSDWKRQIWHIYLCAVKICAVCVLIVYNFPVLLCAKCANFAVFAWWWCGLCRIWVIRCNFQEFTGFSHVHWPWVLIAWILCSSQELWAKCTKSGRICWKFREFSADGQ